jgi:hypothetical protein
LAFVELCEPLLSFMGHRWPLLSFIELYGPSLAFVELYKPLWAVMVDLHWLNGFRII